MSGSNEAIQSLREALKVSPDNVPLRQHLAETLLAHGFAEEAESEFSTALAAQPFNQKLKAGLAAAFFQQGKNSQALVLVEDITRQADAPARVILLHARLLLKAGEVREAVKLYRRAVAADASMVDEELAERLGIGAEETTSTVVDGRLRQPLGALVDIPDSLVERPRTTFQDVGGMDGLKEEIRLKIIHPLTHPDIYKAYGKPIGGGILMYGPPGCGKTYLARATAGEIKAGFIAVGINDVVEMWIGESERNLHELFEQARRGAPCVLFFDEVDALAASRSDMRQSAGRQVINQFLAELDGVESCNEGVLVLAATNAPWHLDQAFRRPGRFDRIIFVPPPDAEARAAILRILVKGKPVEQIDFEQLAGKSEKYSGADLKAVVDLAVESKLAQAMKEGVPKPLSTRDLLDAFKKVKPSTSEWFATARNYALYSNQGGAYDEILRYLKL